MSILYNSYFCSFINIMNVYFNKKWEDLEGCRGGMEA